MTDQSLLTSQDLIDLISHLPPADLKALNLLRDLQANSPTLFPSTKAIKTEDLILATAELRAYLRACRQMGEHLKTLHPIPDSRLNWEFGL